MLRMRPGCRHCRGPGLIQVAPDRTALLRVVPGQSGTLRVTAERFGTLPVAPAAIPGSVLGEPPRTHVPYSCRPDASQPPRDLGKYGRKPFAPSANGNHLKKSGWRTNCGRFADGFHRERSRSVGPGQLMLGFWH